VVNLSKIAKWADVFLDLLGVAMGSFFLVMGVASYRDGGAVGWAAFGAVLFLVNLWVAGRRFVRRRKPAPSA
jgi:hypothetical protein